MRVVLKARAWPRSGIASQPRLDDALSRNSLVPEIAAPANSSLTRLESPPQAGEYLDLIRRLFHSHSVVAVIGSGTGSRGPEACRGIAAELAASGNRVVIVEVDTFLRTNTFPDVSTCQPGRLRNVFLWPPTIDAPIELSPSPVSERWDADWLGALRRGFDAVLLDCPPVETEPASATIAAMADWAVLTVEAGHTSKQQIESDQRALELRGVKLAGCILMRRR